MDPIVTYFLKIYKKKSFLLILSRDLLKNNNNKLFNGSTHSDSAPVQNPVLPSISLHYHAVTEPVYSSVEMAF